jgi:LytS/YehU family sensor histidine kinase
MITLTQELETLNIYIEFEQMRFNKHFEFIQHVDSSVDLSGTMIQPMTIQPFVENAIWHGLKPKEKDRLLTLSISKEGKMLSIVIEDNGIGRQNSKAMKEEGFMHETKSYGLQITKERFAILRNIRGKKSEFEIKDLFDNDNVPSGTRVTIYYEI